SPERLALPARHARLETTHTPLAPAQGTASQVRSSCSPTGTTSHRERPHYDAGGTVHRVLVQKRCAPANRTGTTVLLLAHAPPRRTAAVHHGAACGGLQSPVFQRRSRASPHLMPCLRLFGCSCVKYAAVTIGGRILFISSPPRPRSRYWWPKPAPS